VCGVFAIAILSSWASVEKLAYVSEPEIPPNEQKDQ